MKKLTKCLVTVLLLALTLTSLFACVDRVVIELRFDSNGGSAVGSITTKGLEKITMPAPPTKEGFEFEGWYLDNGVWNQPFTGDSLLGVLLTENKTVYAKWSESIFTYTIDGNNVTITGFETETKTECVIPSSILGRTVVGIGDFAFEDRSIKKITLPDTLTTIGICAFAGTDLTSIKIPSSVKRIGAGAFNDCYDMAYGKKNGFLYLDNWLIGIENVNLVNLTRIIISADTIGIIDGIFDNSSDLQWIEVEANNLNFKSIDGNLYSKDGSTLLLYAIGKAATTFNVPDQVTSIGECAFENCTTLTRILFSSSVANIAQEAFYGCGNLKSIEVDANNLNFTSIDGNLYSKDGSTLFLYATGKAEESFEVPSSVTSIGGSAFKNCSALTSITLPVSVTSIGGSAFKNCSALTSLTLSNGLTSIGESAFEGCSALISLALPSSVTSIGESAFEDCSALTSLALPDGITSIGESTFNYCTALTSLTLPDGITSIGGSAFSYCTALTSLALPKNLTSIGGSAFEKCTALKSITLPSGITRIGGSVFKNCYALAKVTFPSGLTSIGDFAFMECSALTSLALPKSLTSIGNFTFGYCSVLTSVAFPSSVTSIGEYAFYRCSVLTSVTFPSTLTSIGKYAFNDCALTSVTLPSSVTSIGSAALGSCAKLLCIEVDANNLNFKSIDGNLYSKDGSTLLQYVGGKTASTFAIPDGVTRIGESAFNDCTLTSVTLPSGLTSIDESAFEDCKFSSITLPSGLTSIGDSAFKNCKQLESIVLPNSVTSIGDSVFEGCFALTSVTLSNNLTSIPYSAFYSCEALTKIVIPNGVTSIKGFAFSDCYALTDVTLPSSLTHLSAKIFMDCHKLISVTLPSSVTNIDQETFYGCGNLESIEVDANNLNFKSIDGNLYSKDGSTLLQYVMGKAEESFDIPEHVTSISAYAFAGNASITTITIPSGVTSIGEFAFEDCSLLTSMIILSGVTSIDDEAFANCDGLTIFAEAATKPNGWYSIYNPIVWGCTLSEDQTYVVSFTKTDINPENCYSIPEPNRLGYTFEGWYADAACTGQIITDLTEVADGTVLYASWL